MLPVSPRELAEARADTLDVLTNSDTGEATITTISRTKDAEGGWTETYGSPVTAAARISQGGLTPSERLIAERQQVESVWVIELPAGTPVSTKSRVTIGGVAYDPFWVQAPKTWELLRRVLAVKHGN